MIRCVRIGAVLHRNGLLKLGSEEVRTNCTGCSNLKLTIGC